MEPKVDISERIKRQILLLDGATATMLSNGSALSLSALYKLYIDAGADIITTNTTDLRKLSASEIIHTDCQNIAIANEAIAKLEKEVHIAGAVGVAANNDAVYTHIRTLLDSHIHCLLFETIYDYSITAHAVDALQKAFQASGISLPVIFSISPANAFSDLHCGTSIKKFVKLVASLNPLAIGFNCGRGPASMTQPLQHLKSLWNSNTILYPNAGTPNANGSYDIESIAFADALKPLIATRQVNIVGGCCGTTPSHIASLRKVIDSYRTVM